MGDSNGSNRIRRRKVSSSYNKSSSYTTKSSSQKKVSQTYSRRSSSYNKNRDVKPMYNQRGRDYIRSTNISEDIGRREYSKSGIRRDKKRNYGKSKTNRDYLVVKRIMLYFVSIVAIITIAAGTIGFGYYKYVTWGMPEVTKKMVQENYISKNTVSIKDMPKDLRNAIVAIEDERFYKHNGVDIQALLRSALHNLLTDSRQGGSTIEMQLSKNLLTNAEVSIERKLKDIHNAYGMDKVMSKDEIIEAYLNNIYFGGGAYGVADGAKYYFGKDVKNLTLAESAMLVGITNNPSIYGNYSDAKGRQKVVLGKMLELGYINEKQYNNAFAEEVYFRSEIDH